MTRLFSSSILMVALAAMTLATSEAEAGNKGKSGFSFSFGGGGQNNNHNHLNNKHCNRQSYTNRYCQIPHYETPAVIVLPKVPAGSTLTLPGRNFGHIGGQVYLHVGSLKLAVEILDWTPDAVQIRLPDMQLIASAKAHIDIWRANDYPAKSVYVWLIPQPITQVILHE